MLMVPVAHFWTSASGRDTVTSWADLTVTAPVNSWPSTLMIRSAENPLKSAGQRAVFSNARRNRSRARGSSWASVGRASLFDIVVMGSLLESHYRYPSAVRPDLFYFHQVEKISSSGLPLLRKIFTGHYRFMVTCHIVTLFTEILGIGCYEDSAETESQSETA